jgi:head-tail adaptor
MYAGLLNEKIEIYSPTSTRNSFGEQVDEMTLSYTTRAKVGHIGGSRQVIDYEIQVPYQKNFVTRIYVPVTEVDWIKYKEKFYRILSIEEDIAVQQKVIITELVNE